MVRSLKDAMFLGVACVMAATSAPTVQAASKSVAHKLPGGASSLNETYQDWQVMCQDSPAGAKCAAVQQAFSNQNHQRILNVQLSPAADGRTTGILIAPLGVALTKGVSLHADGKAVGDTLGFTACVGEGCIAPLAFNKAQLATLKSAKKVEVKLASLSGQNISLPFSPKGLGDAVARASSLTH